MPYETFTSDKSTLYPGPTDGKKYPILLVLHGLSGLDDVFGPQIKSFAQSLAGLGYVAAVPQYFQAGTPPESDQSGSLSPGSRRRYRKGCRTFRGRRDPRRFRRLLVWGRNSDDVHRDGHPREGEGQSSSRLLRPHYRYSGDQSRGGQLSPDDHLSQPQRQGGGCRELSVS